MSRYVESGVDSADHQLEHQQQQTSQFTRRVKRSLLDFKFLGSWRHSSSSNKDSNSSHHQQQCGGWATRYHGNATNNGSVPGLLGVVTGSACSSTDSGCPTDIFALRSAAQSPSSPQPPPPTVADSCCPPPPFSTLMTSPVGGVVSSPHDVTPSSETSMLTLLAQQQRVQYDSVGAMPAAATTLTLNSLLTGSRMLCCRTQDMITVHTVADFIRKKDLARIKLALREARFDINAKDEVSHVSL